MPDSAEAIEAAYADLDAALTRCAALDTGAVTHPTLVGLLDRQKRVAWQLPALAHPMIARLAAEASPKELGARSLPAALALALRISAAEAKQRIGDAKILGPRTTLTGQPLEPLLARTAAAQARGDIGAQHVRYVREFFHDLPIGVDVEAREKAEQTLIAIAVGHGPEGTKKAADRLAAVLDEDGPMPNDADRARKRFIRISAQGADGMSKLTGNLDPRSRAIWEAVQATLGAPGMANPDDTHPQLSGTPSQARIDADTRTHGQRAHDAWAAAGELAIASGALGRHNGLPVTVIVTTTVQELQSAAGVAVTGGGSLLPMTDLIAMAARGQGHHYMAVFDKHTRQELYLGRSRRFASSGQRIMCIARDRGCTKPGCTSGAYDCQVHHLVDFGRGKNGLTDIDSLTLACPPDNRAVHDGSWTTIRGNDARTQWIPPPHLDTGQRRTNDYHHPERMLKDNDPDDDEPA